MKLWPEVSVTMMVLHPSVQPSEMPSVSLVKLAAAVLLLNVKAPVNPARPT